MSAHSTPGRSIAPIDLPLKIDKQVRMNGANVYVTLDANSDRL